MTPVIVLVVLTIFGLIVLVGYQEVKIKHLQTVIEWCDERESRIMPLFGAFDALRKARLPTSGVPLNEMFLGNIPSRPAVENAGVLLQDMKTQNDAIRKVFSVATNQAKEAVEGLIEWEREHPVPVKDFPF